jgi:hypothetical protein
VASLSEIENVTDPRSVVPHHHHRLSEIRQYLGMPQISTEPPVCAYRGQPLIFF